MRTLTLFLLLAVPAAAQDLSDVVAAMEKAVEPIKDLVILEEGSIQAPRGVLQIPFVADFD